MTPGVQRWNCSPIRIKPNNADLFTLNLKLAPSLLTLFFLLARLIRSMPIPRSTNFIEVNRLSNTAGCGTSKRGRVVIDQGSCAGSLMFSTLKVMSSCLEKPWLWIILICFIRVVFPLSAGPDINQTDTGDGVSTRRQ